MSFITYFDLIDDSKLPPNSYYIEPRDLYKVLVDKADTYLTFSQKVIAYRASKKYPKLNPNELRFLILSSLEKNTSKQDLPKYFEQKASLPQFGQLAMLAKTITANIGQRSVGYNTRQERAKKCLSCVIHRGRNNVAAMSAMKQVINAVADNSHETLKDLQLSPEEEKLGTCGMCGCGLKAKVAVSSLGVLSSLGPNHIDTLLKVYGYKAFDMCWILNEALQDHNLKGLLEAKLKSSAVKGKELYLQYINEKLKESKSNG